MVIVGEAATNTFRDGLGNIIFICVFLLVLLGVLIWWLRR